MLLLAGGLTPTGQDPGVRLLDLTCASSCGVGGTSSDAGADAGASSGTSMGTFVWGSGLPIPLTGASVFGFPGSGLKYPAMVVGNELISGLTHAYLLNSAGAQEVATKVPHTFATAIASPLGFGSVLLFGGADNIESLFPPQPQP
jgi:hypothetical protein